MQGFMPLIKHCAVVILTVIITVVLWGNLCAGDVQRHVLVLNSYHQGYKWTDDETRGVVDTLRSSDTKAIITIDYMDTKRIDTKDYFLKLMSVYKLKYATQHFDLIISTDNDAFNFLKEYRDSVFGPVPVVFCGVNYFSPAELNGVTGFTGVNEVADFKASLDIGLKLHPDTKNIFVIIDRTTTGVRIHDIARVILAQYPPTIRFTLLENLTMAELLDRVRKVPDHSIILHTVFFRDATGRFFNYDDVMERLAQNSPVQIYGLWDFNLGHGMVGGMLTSGYSQGQAAAKIAVRILAGENPDSIPVLMKSPNHYMFDYRCLTRFGIKVSDLPAESIIINKPMTFMDFYQKNKIFVQGMIILSLSVMALVLFISMVKLKRSALEREELILRLREALSQIKTLKGIIPVCAHCKKTVSYTHLTLPTKRIV